MGAPRGKCQLRDRLQAPFAMRHRAGLHRGHALARVANSAKIGGSERTSQRTGSKALRDALRGEPQALIEAVRQTRTGLVA